MKLNQITFVTCIRNIHFFKKYCNDTLNNEPKFAYSAFEEFTIAYLIGSMPLVHRIIIEKYGPQE